MLHRRRWRSLGTLTVLIVAGLLGQGLIAQPETEADAQPFSHRWLQDQARERATQDYRPEVMAEDNSLRALSYDDYRRIVFDPDAAIWGDPGQPFHLQLFHPGFLHTTPVDISLVSDGRARPLAFTPEVFDYHDSPVQADQVDVDGYAGFRVHYPINTSERHEEFLVFLGASYFRAVGQGQFYGLSARGLAVNTVGDGEEEFPRFSDFWIEKPEKKADEIVIHALLDSPSVTGAYRFTVRPGERTRMDVEAQLYPRRDLANVGIAPLTSMFLFDATNRPDFDDFRGAVHDSDGLQILQANGEQIWRPLINSDQVQVSSFGAASTAPKGFGLLQRPREFGHFNDNEARYDKRPSLWIEPQGDWGKGRVELVEIPTDVEYHDNIVTYWQPQDELKAGEEYRFRYRMHWGVDSPAAPEQGRVLNTAAGIVPTSGERLFVIDYSDGRRIPGVTYKPDAVRINATTSAGEITDVNGTLVEANGHYRVALRLDPDDASLAELRVALQVDGEPWGETWLYRWTP